MDSNPTLKKRTTLDMAIINRDMNQVERLLQDFPEIVHPAVIEFSPLHEACFNNDVEMASLLLKNGAHPNITLRDTKYEIPPLHEACYNGDVKMVELLLNHGADPCAILHNTMYDISPLLICRIIDSQNHSDIEELLRKHIPASQQEYANKQVREKLERMSAKQIRSILAAYNP